MTRQQFLTAVKLARSPGFDPIPYLSESMAVFSGCALDKDRRAVTLHEVASLIFGHCATFGGTWLHIEENPIAELSKRFDLIG